MKDAETDVAAQQKKLTNGMNFGGRGWSLIILVGLCLFFSASTFVNGLNVTVGALAKLRGWNYAELLGFTTISGLLSIPGMLLFGFVLDKIGPRYTMTIGLIGGGLSYIWYGHTTSLVGYAISLALVSMFSNVYAWIGGGAYMSNWFPTKKDKALGFSAMGPSISSAIIVVVFAFLAKHFGGVVGAITFIGIIMLVTSIWSWFTPDTPEEAGKTPDNLPIELEESLIKEQTGSELEEADEDDDWSIAKTVKTKECWFLIFACGAFMATTVGIMSQLVPRLRQVGMSQTSAISMMTVVAICGIISSYVWGSLGQKFGTKNASVAFSGVYAFAVLLNMLPSAISVYASCVLIGLCIGGNNIWPIATVANTYGRKRFAKAYTLINPLISCVRMFGFAICAFSLSWTGAYTGGYLVFMILCLLGGVALFFANDKKYARN